MLSLLFRSKRFEHDLWAFSPWFFFAFLLFLLGASPLIPDRRKLPIWGVAALCALIGFLGR